MNIWIASMECASLAEAGGVKNVTYSFCKELTYLGKKVTLFIPFYSFTNLKNTIDLNRNHLNNIKINLCGKTETVNFYKARYATVNFKIVFVYHPAFFEKEAVYTYTEHEQALNENHRKGSGHADTLFLDTLFAKSVAEYAKLIDAEALPDLVHCQDASTAMIPAFIKEASKTEDRLSNIKSVVTIHNAGPAYHHSFFDMAQAEYHTGLSRNILCGALNNCCIEPFLLAQISGAALTTVSVEYAEELFKSRNLRETDGLSDIFYQRHIKIKGITNGIDYDNYNPNRKEVSELPYVFNPEKCDLKGKYKCREYFINEYLQNKELKELVYGSFEPGCAEKKENIFISYHGRIAGQKGISVLIQAIPLIISHNPKVHFIITGQGELFLESQIKELTERFKGKIIFINCYDKKAARLTTVSGDFIVLPSQFEPCGLEDFIAQIYGTLPIAHKTGGLNKILDDKTGFLYRNNTPAELAARVGEAINIKTDDFPQMMKMIVDAANYVHEKYLWKSVILQEYIPFFEKILKK